MDPIVALATFTTDTAIDAGKGKLMSAIKRIVGATSDEQMTGAIKTLEVERDVVHEVAKQLGVDLILRRISGGRGSSEPHDTAS